MKRAYPVIFTRTKDIVLIEVPDMGVLSEGTDIADAIEMARDAIGVAGISMEDNGETIKEASDISDADPAQGTFAGEGVSFVSMVDVDFTEYRKKHDNRMVKKNCTIPYYLNVEAEKEGINFSRVLQEALTERLQC